MNPGKADAQELLDALLPFAKQMLQQHREFFPFGGRMSQSGTIAHIGATDGTDHPPSQPLIQLMKDSFRSEALAGDLRTCGIVYDVRTVPPNCIEEQDAIAVALDHFSGYSVVVLFPYQFSSSGELQVESPFAVEGDYFVFGRPQ